MEGPPGSFETPTHEAWAVVTMQHRPDISINKCEGGHKADFCGLAIVPKYGEEIRSALAACREST